MKTIAGKWLEIRAFVVSVVSGSTDKFPLSDRVKLNKSAAVTLVSLSKVKIGD